MTGGSRDHERRASEGSHCGLQGQELRAEMEVQYEQKIQSILVWHWQLDIFSMVVF